MSAGTLFLKDIFGGTHRVLSFTRPKDHHYTWKKKSGINPGVQCRISGRLSHPRFDQCHFLQLENGGISSGGRCWRLPGRKLSICEEVRGWVEKRRILVSNRIAALSNQSFQFMDQLISFRVSVHCENSQPQITTLLQCKPKGSCWNTSHFEHV